MRTIRHEASASQAFDKALEKWPRAEEVWNAIEWTLARDPDAGTALNEAGTLRAYKIHGARSVGWPTLYVIYRLDGPEALVFEDAVFEEAGPYRAGHA